ncbi:MAG: hypothetical protein JW757_02960 [Anaerolineales bacterium]|nr:hypothetical protein [Anaerolineales bacterium]
MSQPIILETKIVPPKLNRYLLMRDRVKKALEGVFDHRLTLVQAGAGYGKSTALAIMVDDLPNTIWYNLSEGDQDPVVFLRRLCYATENAFPSITGLPTTLLDAWDSARGPLPSREVVAQYLHVVGAGIGAPAVLIFDDLHQIAETSEIALILDNLIGLAPENLHFVGATRVPIQLPNLYRWRSQGQVLEIDQSMLMFSEEEIKELFEIHYHYELTPDEIEDLYAATEGWVISLQLIGRALFSGSVKTIKEALSRRNSPLESLFEILAHDVLEDQSAEMKDFMRKTSVLRSLTTDVCNWLLGIENSNEYLKILQNNDLFISQLGGGDLRYHPLFQQFLNQLLLPAEKENLHLRAAEYYRSQDRINSAIYHYLRAEDFFNAADLLDSYSGELQALGHLDTLANYLDSLSPDVLGQFPNLIYYLGDLARLHSRFQDALAWYQQAEALFRERGNPVGVSRSLRGQARIYLDTVNPARAEELLQQALRLSDGTTDREAKVRLYQLLAENKLNLGNVEEAKKLRDQAEILRREGPADSELWVRVLLRTGKLEEALQQLEKLAQEEASEPVYTPRAHRETQLLLSLIYALQGEKDKALLSAEAGIVRGRMLSSPFVKAVGYMRKGSALMMGKADNESYQQAEDLFQRAIQISKELSVARLRVEAFWGLTRVNGYQGKLDEALSVAEIGCGIANQAGDEWIASHIRMSLGTSYLLEGKLDQALEWLDQSVRGFDECSDSFGLSAARMWQCLAWFKKQAFELLIPTLEDVFSVCRKNQYDYLLYRRTMVGLPDERIIAPLLIWARENRISSPYAEKLLAMMGLPGIESHPGYQLRVKTLGNFELWRGNSCVAHSDWKRENTCRLFQLLLTFRNSPLDRDQICEYLWPGIKEKAAQGNFKVSLNTLFRVLEPDRIAGSESAFVLREGSVYGLRPGCDLSLDVDTFEAEIKRAEKLTGNDIGEALEAYRNALGLYNGEYLPDARFKVWSAVEREHLAVTYLQSADRFCELSLKLHRFVDVIDECQKILGQDTCWERAYRHLMVAYDGLGDHGQLARTYHRCVEVLRSELGIDPSPETQTLFKQLTKAG